MARLKTTVKALTKWTNYVYDLAGRRLDYGKTTDGKTTSIHPHLVKIEKTLKDTVYRLDKRERLAANRALNEQAFGSFKGHPKAMEAAMKGARIYGERILEGKRPSNQVASKPKSSNQSNSRINPDQAN